jgi:hypothetical protein
LAQLIIDNVDNEFDLRIKVDALWERIRI